MPALSYKERFCPFVKDYSKTQSIRAFRKYPFRFGQKLSHFFGMRTKHCTRLIPDNICAGVQTFYILKDGTAFIGEAVPGDQARKNLKLLQKKATISGIIKLNDRQKNVLAWKDGFRTDPHYIDSECQLENVAGCFDLMFRWWKQTHSLPFAGQLVKWMKA